MTHKLTADEVTRWAQDHVGLLVGAAGGVLLLTAAGLAFRKVRQRPLDELEPLDEKEAERLKTQRHQARRAQQKRRISQLINVAALIATSVQATGMWKFFGNVLRLPIVFQVGMFAFMEIALLACGLRARMNVEDGEDAGVDGILVVFLALASGFMASTDAANLREVLLRIMVSVVVAVLWSRDLMAAKREARKSEKPTEDVRWRFSVKELGVKLGFATTDDATLAGRDANRRMDKFMRAAERHTALLESDPAGQNRQTRRAADRKARTKGRLNRYARLHADPTRLVTVLGTRAVDEALDMMDVTKAVLVPATELEAMNTAATESGTEIARLTGELEELRSKADGHTPAATDTLAPVQGHTPPFGRDTRVPASEGHVSGADTPGAGTRVPGQEHSGGDMPDADRFAEGHAGGDTLSPTWDTRVPTGHAGAGTYPQWPMPARDADGWEGFDATRIPAASQVNEPVADSAYSAPSPGEQASAEPPAAPFVPAPRHDEEPARLTASPKGHTGFDAADTRVPQGHAPVSVAAGSPTDGVSLPGGGTVGGGRRVRAGHTQGHAPVSVPAGRDTPPVSLPEATDTPRGTRVPAEPTEADLAIAATLTDYPQDVPFVARLLIGEVPANEDGTMPVRRVKDALGLSTGRAQRVIAAAQLVADPPADPLTDTGEFPAVTDEPTP